MTNSLDKFQLGVRKLIEDLMIQRMAENDKIVTRYMDDGDFQRTAFPSWPGKSSKRSTPRRSRRAMARDGGPVTGDWGHEPA
ncbi:MAG: hypothetical protein Q8M01_03430 [Rubrivivax sp.]|nr:hypothetical protein [Rubrivivax sp.]